MISYITQIQHRTLTPVWSACASECHRLLFGAGQGWELWFLLDVYLLHDSNQTDRYPIRLLHLSFSYQSLIWLAFFLTDFYYFALSFNLHSFLLISSFHLWVVAWFSTYLSLSNGMDGLHYSLLLLTFSVSEKWKIIFYLSFYSSAPAVGLILPSGLSVIGCLFFLPKFLYGECDMRLLWIGIYLLMLAKKPWISLSLAVPFSVALLTYGR